MHVSKNKSEQALEVEEAIKQNDGYCCCAIERSEDTKCMCKDFKDKLNDPSFEGDCHCGLFTKTK